MRELADGDHDKALRIIKWPLDEALALFEQRVFYVALEAYRWNVLHYLLEIPITKKGRKPKKPDHPAILKQTYGD